MKRRCELILWFFISPLHPPKVRVQASGVSADGNRQLAHKIWATAHCDINNLEEDFNTLVHCFSGQFEKALQEMRRGQHQYYAASVRCSRLSRASWWSHLNADELIVHHPPCILSQLELEFRLTVIGRCFRKSCPTVTVTVTPATVFPPAPPMTSFFCTLEVICPIIISQAALEFRHSMQIRWQWSDDSDLIWNRSSRW